MNDESINKIKCMNSIVIFGCGKYGKIIFRYLIKRMKEDRVICFADNNCEKIKRCCGKKVIQPELAKTYAYDALWIISSLKNLSSMRQQLYEMQIDATNILEITEDDIRVMYKYIHKWYNEDKYFMYDYGFPINFQFVVNLVKAFFRGKYYDFVMKTPLPIERNDKQYKYNVSICAIFLNEAPYIREWIEFHKMVGVEHFYMYNNMSTDGYRDILTPYVEEGIVTLIDWNMPHGQVSAYWDCVNRFSEETKWVGFIDLDEFVVPHKNKIYDFLKQYDDKWGSVLIYWRTYGSSGRESRELGGLVTEDFKKCWRKLEDVGKCFYNTAFPLSGKEKNGLGFYHVCWTKRNGRDFPPVNIYGKVFVPGSVQRASTEPISIQINHYLTKSFKEYQKKMVQPDATFEKNPRTEACFIYYDNKADSTDNIMDQYLPELKERLRC